MEVGDHVEFCGEIGFILLIHNLAAQIYFYELGKTKAVSLSLLKKISLPKGMTEEDKINYAKVYRNLSTRR